MKKKFAAVLIIALAMAATAQQPYVQPAQRCQGANNDGKQCELPSYKDEGFCRAHMRDLDSRTGDPLTKKAVLSEPIVPFMPETISLISGYTSGQRLNPRRDKIRALASSLNVSDGWLMGGDVPMERLPSDIPTSGAVSAEQLLEVVRGFQDVARIDAETNRNLSAATLNQSTAVKDQAATIKNLSEVVAKVDALSDKVEQLSLFGDMGVPVSMGKK